MKKQKSKIAWTFNLLTHFRGMKKRCLYKRGYRKEFSYWKASIQSVKSLGECSQLGFIGFENHYENVYWTWLQGKQQENNKYCKH